MEEQPVIQPSPESVTNEILRDISPTTSPMEPKKKSKKWIIIGLVFLFLSTSGIASYFAYQNYQLKKEPVGVIKPAPSPIVEQPSPTKDPTAGWKDYKSTLLGFTIKYPNDWYLSRDILTNYDIINYESSKEDSLTWQKTKMKCDFANYNPSDAELANERIVVDNGVTVLQGIAKDNSNLGGPGLGTGVFFVMRKNDNNSIALLCYAYNQSLEQEMIKILSTFKFINQAIDTTGWKTYQNKEHGFEFKHPTNYLLSDNFLKINSEDDQNYLGIIINKDIYKKLAQYPMIYISIVDSKKTPQEFLDFDYQRELTNWEGFEEERGFKIDKPQIVSTEEVTNSLITALRVVRERVPSAPNTTETQYLFRDNGLLYNLYARYGTYNPDTGEDGTDEKNTLDGIFSSFKLTD